MNRKECLDYIRENSKGLAETTIQVAHGEAILEFRSRNGKVFIIETFPQNNGFTIFYEDGALNIDELVKRFEEQTK